MSQHPYSDSARTDLGGAFLDHQTTHRRNATYTLCSVETGTLDVIASRSDRDPETARLRDELAGLLAQPESAGAAFQPRFLEAYAQARARACPLWAALLPEHHKLIGISRDYTLTLYDPFVLHTLEEEAPSDPTVKTFIGKMLDRLAHAGRFVDQKAYRQAFEIYSEAVVYRLLRDAGAGQITVERLPEVDSSTPDFKCTMTGNPERTFYIEVKTLDIVHADQRHAEMLDEGMLVQDQLDKQVAGGKRIAMTVGEIAPYRKFGGDPDYDWRSVRMSIERLIEKCRQCFKASQFQLGPTFALASLLRMPIHDHGARPLAPFA